MHDIAHPLDNIPSTIPLPTLDIPPKDPDIIAQADDIAQHININDTKVAENMRNNAMDDIEKYARMLLESIHIDSTNDIYVAMNKVHTSIDILQIDEIKHNIRSAIRNFPTNRIKFTHAYDESLAQCTLHLEHTANRYHILEQQKSALIHSIRVIDSIILAYINILTQAKIAYETQREQTIHQNDILTIQDIIYQHQQITRLSEEIHRLTATKLHITNSIPINLINLQRTQQLMQQIKNVIECDAPIIMHTATQIITHMDTYAARELGHAINSTITALKTNASTSTPPSNAVAEKIDMPHNIQGIIHTLSPDTQAFLYTLQQNAYDNDTYKQLHPHDIKRMITAQIVRTVTVTGNPYRLTPMGAQAVHIYHQQHQPKTTDTFTLNIDTNSDEYIEAVQSIHNISDDAYAFICAIQKNAYEQTYNPRHNLDMTKLEETKIIRNIGTPNNPYRLTVLGHDVLERCDRMPT